MSGNASESFRGKSPEFCDFRQHVFELDVVLKNSTSFEKVSGLASKGQNKPFVGILIQLLSLPESLENSTDLS